MSDDTNKAPSGGASAAILTPVLISALRTIFVMGGAFAVGRQWMTQESLDTLSDPTTFATLLLAAATVGAAVWGVFTKRRQGILKDASKVLGSDGVIIAPEKIADKLPKNVVSTVGDAESVAPPAARRSPRHPPHVVPPAATN